MVETTGAEAVEAWIAEQRALAEELRQVYLRWAEHLIKDHLIDKMHRSPHRPRT